MILLQSGLYPTWRPTQFVNDSATQFWRRRTLKPQVHCGTELTPTTPRPPRGMSQRLRVHQRPCWEADLCPPRFADGRGLGCLGVDHLARRHCGAYWRRCLITQDRIRARGRKQSSTGVLAVEDFVGLFQMQENIGGACSDVTRCRAGAEMK